MMRIRWTPAAAADVEHISDYLKQHRPHRQPTMHKLYDTIRSLTQSPYGGRPSSEEGTREIVFPPLPYVAAYRVKNQTSRIALSLRRAERALLGKAQIVLVLTQMRGVISK